MAFNPSPKVSTARDFARKFDQEMVIIFFVDRDGQFGYASYGETRTKCNAAKRLADTMFEAVTR